MFVSFVCLCHCESLPEVILETENRLRRETHLKRENLSDMNLAKDEFPLLNLSVHVPV